MKRIIKIVVAIVGFFCAMQVTAKSTLRSAEMRISKGYDNASRAQLTDHNFFIQKYGIHSFKYTLPEDDNDEVQLTSERDDVDKESKPISFNRSVKLFSLFHELAGTAQFFIKQGPEFSHFQSNTSIYNCKKGLYLQLLIIKI